MSNIVQIPVVEITTDSINIPIKIEDVKNFLRIDSINDDELLTRLIKSATKKCESYIGKSLITKTYKISFENCVLSKVKLPYGPVQSISSVTSKDSLGNIEIIAPENYSLNTTTNTATFNYAVVNHIIEITYASGYGDLEMDIPEDIKQGLLFHIARLYDDRGGYSKIPNASTSLYSQYKNVRI